MTVSIIIPTLNEATALPQTLEQLRQLRPQPVDIIVVDANSNDTTVEVAKRFGVTVIESAPRGRATQMNLGVTHAKGEHLCFLHADTDIPVDFVSLASTVLSDPRVALAGFVSIMRGPKGVRRLTTAHNFT